MWDSCWSGYVLVVFVASAVDAGFVDGDGCGVLFAVGVPCGGYVDVVVGFSDKESCGFEDAVVVWGFEVVPAVFDSVGVPPADGDSGGCHHFTLFAQ